MNQKAPDLNILILCGGLSSRMGKSKALLLHDKQTLLERIIQQISGLNLPVFISCRKDQSSELNFAPVILDTEESKGPMSGIKSAFLHYPKASWLILTCDMPNIDSTVLSMLIQGRESNIYDVITFQSDHSDGFETFPALWEREALADKVNEYDRPSDVIRNSRTKTIPIQESQSLLNINTYEQWTSYIKSLS